MQQIAIRLPAKMIAALDRVCKARLDEPDRTQLIREYIAKGIASEVK
jgi:hypothetical protein